MGNEFASYGGERAVGRQTLVSSVEPVRPAPGKTTLAEALPPYSSPVADLQRVAARAGERVVDKGKFEYVVGADGAFEVVKAPPPYAHAKGKRITLDALPGVWGVLHDLLLAQPAAAASARPPTAKLSADDQAANDKRVRTKAATIEGSTLDIAKTRADLGNANTHYKRTDATKAEVNMMVNGDKDAATFWCSGFSMWTLAAAGYDLSSPVVGTDGKPFTFTSIESSKDAAAVAKGRKNENLMKQLTDAGIELADDEYPAFNKVTFRGLVDGWGLHVKAMAKIDRDGLEKGSWLGIFRASDNGYTGLLDGEDGPARAATGAPGAFEALGIGRVVPEAEQKPGDFAQERWKNKKTGVHDGTGHAFQVWSVRAKGAAMFGKPGSPQHADDAAAIGWQEGAPFVITKDTDPSLVGDHVVLAATRIEANLESTMKHDEEPEAGKAKGAKQPAGDGGVQITGEVEVPDPVRNAGLVVFYGRLASSPWERWTKATKPSE